MTDWNVTQAHSVASKISLREIEQIQADVQNSIKRFACYAVVLIADSILREPVDTPNHTARLDWAEKVLNDGSLFEFVRPWVDKYSARLLLTFLNFPGYTIGQHPDDFQIIWAVSKLVDDFVTE